MYRVEYHNLLREDISLKARVEVEPDNYKLPPNLDTYFDVINTNAASEKHLV